MAHMVGSLKKGWAIQLHDVCVCVFRVSSFYQALRSQAESQWQTEEPQQGILVRTTKTVYKIGYF